MTRVDKGQIARLEDHLKRVFATFSSPSSSSLHELLNSSTSVINLSIAVITQAVIQYTKSVTLKHTPITASRQICVPDLLMSFSYFHSSLLQGSSTYFQGARSLQLSNQVSLLSHTIRRPIFFVTRSFSLFFPRLCGSLECVFGKLPTYAFPGQNVGSGQGQVGSFPETYTVLDCKTVRIFAYSSTCEQSSKRSGTRLKRLLRHALPISLLILRKKNDCFAV